jgi:hypothetical protein
MTESEPEEHTMSTEDDRKAKQILAAFEPLAGMGEKATPGPWRHEADIDAPLDRPSILVYGSRPVDRSAADRADVRAMPATDQKVAYVYTPTVPAGPRGGQKCTAATVCEATANARLIAAAPDLLAACKALASIPVELFSTGNGPGKDPKATIHSWCMRSGETIELRVEHVLAARAAIARATK